MGWVCFTVGGSPSGLGVWSYAGGGWGAWWGGGRGSVSIVGGVGFRRFEGGCGGVYGGYIGGGAVRVSLYGWSWALADMCGCACGGEGGRLKMGSPVDGLRRCPFTSPDITFKASTEWAFAEDIVFPEYYTIWAGILSLHVFPACAKACHLPPSCYAPYCLEGECHPDFVTAMLNPRSGESEEVTEEEEEEEHLALADSTIVVPIDEPIFPPEGTKPVIPPPTTDITIGARITIRP
ncbi:hypothetical protein Tco_0978107 [Tanacetum coccineum]|uniref:Uncharacterized protein n=1 Tax=Tanacetum coccineum TaxID=301880 RepID=A0ABQ5EM34_9ASTR